MSEITVRPITPNDVAWVRGLLTERWGSARIVSRGILHDATVLPGFIAELEGRAQGVVTFHIAGTACEIVTLDALYEGQGIGSELIGAVRRAAAGAGCSRLWLVTTNDNEKAIRFYEHAGFRFVSLHANALEESRRLKPEIPLMGIGGVPLRDELEFEVRLRE